MTTPPEDLLSAYLDGELTPAERATVEAQLEESAEWREVLVELRETRALLRGLPVHDAPVGFWDEMLDADAVVSPPVSLDAKRRGRRSTVIAWAAGAAAAAAIAAVVLVPTKSTVKPAVATMVNAHAARSSVSEEPVSELAPVAAPVKVGR